MDRTPRMPLIRHRGRRPLHTWAMALGGAGLAAAGMGIGLLGIAPALASGATPAAVPRAPGFQSVLYDTDIAATVIAHGESASGASIGPGLTPARGAMRQEPSGSHVMGPNASDAAYRVAKINARQLIGLTASQMAGLITGAINGHCAVYSGGIVRNFGCASHLVTIDEVSPAFADPSTGGRGRAGQHFSQAMALLSRTPSPWGTSYAARVGVYVDAGMTVSISIGRGPNRNLNTRNKPQYATYRGVMPGLARAGSLWIEMYQGVYSPSGMRPLTLAQWRTVPSGFASYLATFGGSLSQLHFMFSNGGGATRSCPDVQACQWAVADTPGVNRTILANGPGEYRLGGQEQSWLNQFNMYFPVGGASQ
jgi:hypothetical protein